MTVSPKEQPRAAERRGRGPSDFSFLEDIGAIVTQSQDLRATLDRIVEAVARRMDTEVCSLYLYDPAKKRLTLWATTGLDRSSVGRVSMDLHEGLVGYVLERMQPVVAIDALGHPRFKFFPETGEEQYHSFLGVPVFERQNPAGVLVVQTKRRRRFRPREVRLLRAIGAHVTGIIAQARLLETLADKEEERLDYQRKMGEALRELEVYEQRQRPGARSRLSGTGASPGFAIGRALFLDTPSLDLPYEEKRKGSIRQEIQRFRKAVEEAVRETAESYRRVQATLPEMDASMFEAHRLILEDHSFRRKVEERIAAGLSAEAALRVVVAEYELRFREMGDAYLRERALDIRDIGRRILRHLLGRPGGWRRPRGAVVLVANELSITDFAQIDPEVVKGIVLSVGGVTSHASILARSLEIPAVVGVEDLSGSVREDDHLVVDGTAGVVYVNPPADIVREYERLDREYRAFSRELETLRELPAETLDGRRLALRANIVLLSELAFARHQGAEGVGLYRTEFPFLSHRDFLSEDEQVELYRKVVEGMPNLPVTIRTLDLGADKYPRYLDVPREQNPFLGWRSIRISLEMADVFKVQLRAILRVAAEGPVRLLLPMISSVDEVRRAKELLEEAKFELQRAGRRFDPRMPVGIMVEVPSAVSLAEELVREVDFFSIGTNDLIQYLLAVDRNNRKVSPLYEPLHPAVLRAIARTAEAARRAGKPVSLCGEMAADPECTVLLLGMGLSDLSMGPFFLPAIKRVVRALEYREAAKLAREILELPTVKDVKKHLFEALRRLGITDIVEKFH
ncbi:MAG: phosphoenolpyruvate--protein phosphotransferase [Candidatus Binatia bacterium]|nr:MAG: phosphoenolpyruvate--protein phosphotransferase [Candidatus Binatia bacterium]